MMNIELIKKLDSTVVKQGFFINPCGSGFSLIERQDGVAITIAYKGTLTELVSYLKSWNCGMILNA